MEGLWRWDLEGGPLWLLQLLTIEGSGAYGQGAMLLLEGQPKAAGRVTNLSKALEGLWEGQYGTTAQQTRLKPQLFFGRYLVVASVASRLDRRLRRQGGQEGGVDPQACRKPTCWRTYCSPSIGRHFVQLNRDGQFFLHEIATGRMALSGRYVDGEIILYTPEGYYWSSYEGAHFVQLRFPGLPGLYSFQQFAAVLTVPSSSRPGSRARAPPTPPRLVPPPVVEARLLQAASADGGGRRVAVQARSGDGLARLRLYEDGRLIADKGVSGQAFDGEIAVPPGGSARWLTVLGTDKGGLVSSPQALPLQPGPGRGQPAPRRGRRRRHLCRGAAEADLCQVGCAAPCGSPEGRQQALLRRGDPARSAR